jgi:hypothetical protein
VQLSGRLALAFAAAIGSTLMAALWLVLQPPLGEEGLLTG